MYCLVNISFENPASEIEKPLNVTIKMLNPVSSWIPFVATDHYHLGDNPDPPPPENHFKSRWPAKCHSMQLSHSHSLPPDAGGGRWADALPFVLCQVQNVQGIRQSHRIPNDAAPLHLRISLKLLLCHLPSNNNNNNNFCVTHLAMRF